MEQLIAWRREKRMIWYYYTAVFLIIYQLCLATETKDDCFVYIRPIFSASFTNSNFGTAYPYNVQLKLLRNGNAFIEVVKYPILPQEFPINVACQGIPPMTFSNWTNYQYNNIYVFRHLLGIFPSLNQLQCVITINNVSETLVSVPAEEPPNYPDVQTHSEPFTITPLAFMDTMGGQVEWTNDALVTDSENYILLQQAKCLQPLPPDVYDEMVDMLGDKKVYISLTTSPSRLMRIHYQFESMDLRNVTTIFITISPLYKDNQPYRIPIKLVQKFPQIQFMFASFDLGPSMKIISVIDYLKEIPGSEQDIVIVMDDDSVYAPSMVNTFIYQSLIVPEGVINASPFKDSLELYAMPPVVHREVPYLRQLNRVEGFSGYSFRAGSFDTDIIKAIIRKDLNIGLTPCFQSDNMVISYTFLFLGVPIYTTDVPDSIFYSYNTRYYLPQYIDYDALHRLNLDGTRSPIEINHFKFSITLEFFADFFINPCTLEFETKDRVVEKIQATYVH